MHLKWRKPAEKAEADRQLVIAYKNFFETDFGRTIFMDLANRFNWINPVREVDPVLANRAEGARAVVCHIFMQTKTDLRDLEAILNGDFKSVTKVEKPKNE